MDAAILAANRVGGVHGRKIVMRSPILGKLCASTAA